VVFVNLGICPGICPDISPDGKNKIKNHGLPEEVGLTQIPVDHAPLSIVRHVGLHVDFSSTNFFLGL
jgi:hypothetical protein